MKTTLLIAFSMLISNCFAQQKTTTTTVKNDNMSVNISETKTNYEFHSTYNKDKTNKVLAYMDNTIAKGSSSRFKNMQVDAQMTLDNGASLYIRSYPGKLDLKLDKRKNSAEIYARFKNMCEGLKDLIQKK